MTTLSKQLDSLRTATAKQLTIEKKHVSLLFDRKEAEKLDRETILKIGSTGFAQLKKLDPSVEDCSEFFDESVLNFQRALITKDENESLNKRLEVFIYKLSPHLLHFCCQQVLEWLINRYQIHAYNAEFVIMSFLPFHDANIFGRLLGILEYNFSVSKDLSFLQEFRKKRLPVPFQNVLKHALSSSHGLIKRVSDHIEKGIEIMGPDFMNTKAYILYTFFTKLTIMAVDAMKVPDENLISKIVPVIGNGLRSSIDSFRNASLMITCQICHNVKLSTTIVSSTVRILLLKMKEATVTNALATLVVICQTQDVEEFPKKATLKFVRRAESVGTWAVIQQLSSQTDLLSFLTPLWSSLFDILGSDATSNDDRQLVITALQTTSQSDMLNGKQAQTFLSLALPTFSKEPKNFPLSIKKDIYNICLRHANEYELFVQEWASRENAALEKFINYMDLNVLTLQKPAIESNKEKRKSMNTEVVMETEEKQTPTERAQVMAMSSEYAKRQKFRGDPIQKALEWLSKKDFENVLWALDEMATKNNYFSNQVEEDVEEIAIRLIEAAQKENVVANKMKPVLSTVVFRPQFVSSLLTHYELQGSFAKKSKGIEKTPVGKVFEDEAEEDYWKRVLLVLEILNASPKLSIDSKLFSQLFDFLKSAQVMQNGDLAHSLQHLSTTLLIKMVTSPGEYKLTAKDIQMDVLVETMRSTQSHHILREVLKLLTAAVQLSPSSITSHIMSVFTFMGSGLLRRDNELTLGIIERTLGTLFSAVIINGQKNKGDIVQKLISISKVFSTSAPDIPAHRRARMAQAISKAVGVNYIWIVICVLIESFCAKWQRNDQNKKSTDQDAFEDIAQELCASLSAPNQLNVILDLINFVIRLGGDTAPPKKLDNIDAAVFDRTKFTVQKLRHFRFVIVGIAVKVLNSKLMLEELSIRRDEDLYNILVPIGKKLLSASVELDEFVIKEGEVAEKSQDAQVLRYWVALQARSDTVAEKLRYLLPGGVAANLIANVLEDEKADCKMREKVLQLANIKLLTDGYFYSESGINEEHLTRLASVLNKWIIPVRGDKDKVELCKNATFSLKLIAKRIPKQSESAILTETMEKAVILVQKWQTLDDGMVGNVLFLAGELIRSHNMRCTMLSCEPLLVVCLSMIKEYSSSSYQNKEEDTSEPRRQRVRQQSLSGKKLGSDTLLIAALTCLQRILDQFATFVSNHMGDILLSYCRLSGKFSFADSKTTTNGTVQHRLSLIRLTLSNMELRTVSAHFAYAVKELVNDQKSLCSLMYLLATYFHQKTRKIILPLRMALLNTIFLPALEIRKIDRKPENFENIAETEKCIFSTFLKMADVLTDSELRPLLTAIVQWAEPALDLKEENKAIRVRLVTLYNFANEFYNYFKQLAMSHFGKLLEMAPIVLAGCNATEISDSSLLLLGGKRDTVEGLETDLLIRQIIIFIENCGRHKEFLSQETIESLAAALISELVNTRVPGHESRCKPHLANALYRICDASPETFSDILNKIMLKTRNNRPKIRFRTLLVLEDLIEKVGDAIAPQLPMIMPFLSELLEDETKKVEDQCDRVIRLLQKKFGETIAEGFA